MSAKTEKNIDWSTEWKQFKKGDQESFRKIYDFFFDRLYWYGFKIFADNELVEDCIQELFLNLYSRRENLSETNNLEFYLLKSLKLTIYQKLRHQDRFNVLNRDLEYFELQLADTDEADGSESSRLELVKASINSLSPAAKEILYLKFYSDLNYKQIGKIMGIQPDSVKKQVYRIINRLKEIVGDYYQEFFCLCFRA